MNRAHVAWIVVLFLAAGLAQAQDPAERSITNTVVSIDVTPPVAPPSGWAFWVATETLPQSLTPSNFSGPNPMWDAATHTIIWSSVTVAPVTLGYEVTGECDTRTVAGDSMFVNHLAEASSFTTTGDTLISGLDPDTTPPVITLLGYAIDALELSTPYVEAGATAYDNCDGDLTAEIIIDNSSVDMNTVGSYIVTYNVSDSSSNAAAEVTRIIDTVDGMYTWAIDVNVLSENTVEVVFNRQMGLGVDVPANYNVSGSGMGNLSVHPDAVSGSDYVWTLAWNNCPIMLAGGDITITVDSSVESLFGMTSSPRPRTDFGGAIATPPALTLLGADPVVVECGAVYTDAGVMASDDQCGNDLTSSVVTVNPVDTSTPGVYFITYNVTDAGGNAATEVTRTVGVVDTTPPVVTRLGDPLCSTTRVVPLGDPYVDAGASAYDACDGDLTASVVVGGDVVDTSVVGIYLITYNVSDSTGNAAVEVIRTVNVSDSAGLSVVAVNVVSSNSVEVVFSKTMDFGVGIDVPTNYTVSGTGIGTLSPHPTSISGSNDTWTLTWDGCPFMLAGGDITVTVNLAVEDCQGWHMTMPNYRTDIGGAMATPPVITLLGTDPVTVECGSVYTDAGVTAIDQCSNDLIASVVTINPVDTSVPGVYTITYNVTDAGGNAATEVTRTVEVVDTTPPVITRLGDPPCSTDIVVELYDTYVDAGASAYDACDGDITASVVTVNPVDVNTIGSYAVTYNVLDSSGNAAVEVIRTVNVGDGMGPYVDVVNVVSHNSVEVVFSQNMGICADIPTYYTISGTGIGTFPPHPTSVAGNGFTWTLTWDGCPIMLAGGDITVTVNPDMTNSVGFPITMPNYGTDIGGAMATPPVITLLGDPPCAFPDWVVVYGNPYVDAAASAYDACDNDISASIITGGDIVDTWTLGSYLITYNVTDSAGNAAAEVIRTVNVIDGMPPFVIEVDVVSHNSVEVVFNKDMDLGAGVDVPANYTISGTGIGTLSPHPTGVTGSNDTWTLTWDGCPFMLIGGDITVTVNPAVEDCLGQLMMLMGNYFTDVGGAIAASPVITLLGDNPATVELGDPYVDAGATALDQCSNDISASINMVDAVNTGILGAYTVTYNVADEAGNMADEVTRTVNVVPAQPDVPAAGGLGLVVLACVTAFGGVAAFRRRR